VRLTIPTVACASFAAAAAVAAVPHARRPVRPTIVNVAPHDPGAYTQGLVLRGGEFYESTGEYGKSTLRAVDPKTGRVRTRAFLPPDVFGEGLTIFGDEIFVLTWKEQTAFVYGLDFLPRRKLAYSGEGWGLTHDETNLIMSDGTSTIRFVDPATFAVRRTIRVHADGRDVRELNELEYARGLIFANIWQEERIVAIAPDSGDVVAEFDLSHMDGAAS
jgi:glutamine cyclotransferase